MEINKELESNIMDVMREAIEKEVHPKDILRTLISVTEVFATEAEDVV